MKKYESMRFVFWLLVSFVGLVAAVRLLPSTINGSKQTAEIVTQVVIHVGVFACLGLAGLLTFTGVVGQAIGLIAAVVVGLIFEVIMQVLDHPYIASALFLSIESGIGWACWTRGWPWWTLGIPPGSAAAAIVLMVVTMLLAFCSMRGEEDDGRSLPSDADPIKDRMFA